MYNRILKLAITVKGLTKSSYLYKSLYVVGTYVVWEDVVMLDMR